jgi:Ankyrin repeats (many copies)/Ankyrin repeats (3 copies)
MRIDVFAVTYLPSVLADAGLPMVAVYLPVAWLALLPIIFIETGYGVWRLKLPMGRALMAQTAANCLSTLVGIPVTWLILALVEWLVLERAAGAVPVQVLSVLSPVIGAAWLGPGVEKAPWIIVVAIAVLTTIFYLMSVVTERPIVGRFFPHVPRQVIRAWTVRANAITYLLLVALIGLAWSAPQRSQPMFSLMDPLSDGLAETVGWVADQVSGLGEAETPLIKAIENRDAAKVRKLIARGANINATDKDGNTALQEAASEGDEKITRLLLDSGAEVTARRKGPINYDALDYAAWTGNGSTVQELLSAGARVNDPTDSGWTPLMIAILYGHPDVVEALLAGGADVNARTPTGWTALKEAQFRGDQENAQRLIRAGAIDYPDGSRE